VVEKMIRSNRSCGATAGAIGSRWICGSRDGAGAARAGAARDVPGFGLGFRQPVWRWAVAPCWCGMVLGVSNTTVNSGWPGSERGNKCCWPADHRIDVAGCAAEGRRARRAGKL